MPVDWLARVVARTTARATAREPRLEPARLLEETCSGLGCLGTLAILGGLPAG